MDNEKLAGFAQLIKDSNNIVFFGGAGVSTESGIKDYRSEDGLYNTVKQYNVSPETILSRSFFESRPDVFYDFYYNFFISADAEPNEAHFALAKLEKIGKLKAVITQNVDGLHQKAGSRNVIELHGTVRRNYCPNCFSNMSLEQVRDFKGKVPKCEKCGHIIKPYVVLYEEALDEKVISAAINAISSADLLIIGGASVARAVHMLCGYWNFVLMSLHLGLHWVIIVGMASKKLPKNKPVLIWLSRIAALLIAGYGAYALTARQVADYLFGKTMFAFFNMSEPVILFLLNYLAIMGTFVFAGHYLSKMLKHIKRRKTL